MMQQYHNYKIMYLTKNIQNTNIWCTKAVIAKKKKKRKEKKQTNSRLKINLHFYIMKRKLIILFGNIILPKFQLNIFQELKDLVSVMESRLKDYEPFCVTLSQPHEK